MMRQVVQAALEEAEAPVLARNIWPEVQQAVTALGPAALDLLPNMTAFTKLVERMRDRRVRQLAV